MSEKFKTFGITCAGLSLPLIYGRWLFDWDVGVTGNALLILGIGVLAIRGSVE